MLQQQQQAKLAKLDLQHPKYRAYCQQAQNMLSLSSGFRICILSSSSGFRNCSLSSSSGFKICNLSSSSGFRNCSLSLSSGFRIYSLSSSSGFRIYSLSLSSGFRFRTSILHTDTNLPPGWWARLEGSAGTRSKFLREGRCRPNPLILMEFSIFLPLP